MVRLVVGNPLVNNALVYYAVIFGSQVVIVGPKVEHDKWKETLSKIAHEINIINLISNE